MYFKVWLQLASWVRLCLSWLTDSGNPISRREAGLFLFKGQSECCQVLVALGHHGDSQVFLYFCWFFLLKAPFELGGSYERTEGEIKAINECCWFQLPEEEVGGKKTSQQQKKMEIIFRCTERKFLSLISINSSWHCRRYWVFWNKFIIRVD